MMVSRELERRFPRQKHCGSPKIRFSNFFSQDSLIFPGTRYGFELVLRSRPVRVVVSPISVEPSCRRGLTGGIHFTGGHERWNQHLYDRGGMRRVHLRGIGHCSSPARHEKISKRFVSLTTSDSCVIWKQ